LELPPASTVVWVKETAMTKDENAWTDPANRIEVEIRNLVENTDLSPLQAKELVAKYGPDRPMLMKIAEDHEGRELTPGASRGLTFQPLEAAHFFRPAA
jgi:hypothetical protein